MVATALGDRKNVLQLHWGGGTPTHLTPDQMRELFDELTSQFHILPEAEVAVEVDPRVTTTDHVDMLAELGFNRLSMGVQDANDEVQVAIGREQTLDETLSSHAYAKQKGISEINIDLVYGLPKQTVEGFTSNLDRGHRARAGPGGGLFLRPCAVDPAQPAAHRRSPIFPIATPSSRSLPPRWIPSPPPAISRSAWTISRGRRMSWPRRGSREPWAGTSWVTRSRRLPTWWPSGSRGSARWTAPTSRTSRSSPTTTRRWAPTSSRWRRGSSSTRTTISAGS